MPPITSAIDRTREHWIRNLIDVSRRNNLLYHRAVRGTIDLTEAAPAALSSLLAGRRVSLADLLPDANPVALNAQARELQRRAQINLEEKGLQTLNLACGMASWPSPDGGRPYEAAVVLLPVSIVARWRDLHSATLERNGDPQVNLALLHVLATDYQCIVDPEALLGETGGNGTLDEEKFDPSLAMNRLADAAARIDGFTISKRTILSNFSFQKMAMVDDLRQHGALFASHDILLALAGDMDARSRVLGNRVAIDPKELDKVPAESEFMVLDADSSQQRVVQAVMRLQDGVIEGPPGTGKSQTIVNLIAALVAGGYRVLFVAEKRAALDVVLSRLQRVGLGHLVLDLHSAETSRATILQPIARSMEVIGHTAPPDTSLIHLPFEDRRKRLNLHVAQLHTSRPPSMLTAYEMQGRLLRAPAGHMKTRWRGADLDQLTNENVAAIKDHLQELANIELLFARDPQLLWTQAHLSDAHAAQAAVDMVARMAHQHLPALQAALDACAAETGLSVPDTLDQLGPFIAYLEQVEWLLNTYAASLFEQDLSHLARALEPGAHTVSHWVATLAHSEYRQALSTMRHLRRAANVSATRLLEETRQAAEVLKIWQANGSHHATPYLRTPVATLQNPYQACVGDVDAAKAVFPGLMADAMTRDLISLHQLAVHLADDEKTPYQVAWASELEHSIHTLGGAAFLDEARRSIADPQRWPEQFEYAWVASCFDKVKLEEPALASFVGATHNQYVSDFSRLDRSRIELAVERVRRAHAERAIEAMNQFPAQDALIRREAEKKRRHLPLRKLLAQAPDVLTAVCPCWMVSPLSVSQLLGAEQQNFDVVIFDEASQIPPEDAAPAIMRAAHVVVAGDVHQLPPMRFFATGEDEPSEADTEPLTSQGFESLLDLMTGFMDGWWLQWHYRSRDEALIAFSNHHIYRDRLVTFPGCVGKRGLSHVLVKPDPNELPARDDLLHTSPAEVHKVVELVLEHARTHPNQSLGVIALGIRHAYQIEDELQRVLPEHPELDAFFDPQRPEPFFVKNLERVQGDERDAIILTLGYCKDRAGRLPYRFGPLLQEGGERRLNVAITRARDQMTVVSSFNHYDMDPNRATSLGVQLLRLYLEYVDAQGAILPSPYTPAGVQNDFEADVFEALSGRGVPLVPQWGTSGYRIDFAAQHPQQPNRMVLAIECDGASYQAVPTARDRDRLRQQHLEDLGWRFHRIWSTDWFLRRQQEIDRAVAAYQAAVALVDERDAERDRMHIAVVQPAKGQPDATQPAESSAAMNGPADPVIQDKPAASPAPAATAGLRRGPKPVLVRQSSIARYEPAELVALVQWISSDGLLRTDEEIIDEMVKELGFKRRGPLIEDAIRQAIQAVPRR